MISFMEFSVLCVVCCVLSFVSSSLPSPSGSLPTKREGGEATGHGRLFPQTFLTIQILSLVTAKVDNDLFEHDTWVIWSESEGVYAIC